MTRSTHWFLAVLVLTMLSASRAQAEVLELEGVVKAVDATARTLSVERKTPNGTKTLDLEVTKKAGDLSAVKVGDRVTFSYDPDLEIVTKLGGGPPSSASGPSAEVIALLELDAAGHEDQPWVTPDGLTIFWTTQKPGEKKQVWTATRKSPQVLFENKKQVTIGQDCAFTADGLEGIVFLQQEGQGNLCAVKRSTVSDSFSRPAVIPEFPASLGFLAGPSLSDDGKTLYLERLSEGGHELLVATRTTKNDRWSQPKLLPITASKNSRRFPHVSSSGKYLICTEPNNDKKSMLTVYRSESPKDPFTYMGIVHVDGKQLPGRFGRYIEATKELFFSRVGKDGLEITVVRPFDPEEMVKPE